MKRTNHRFSLILALSVIFVVFSCDDAAAWGGGDGIVTWTPDMPAAGNYNVYAWWVEAGDNATNAKYAIYYDGGSSPGITVNQRVDGGQWNLLGTYPFAAGTLGSVVLTNEGADGAIVADAIKLENEGAVVDPSPIVSPPGDWNFVSGEPTAYSDIGDYYYHEEGTGTATATWTPDVTDAGNYRVYAWWVSAPDAATNAKYSIYYDGGSSPGITVNQRAYGGQWNLLGTYPFVAGISGSVELNDDANGKVVADAVGLVPAGAGGPPDIIGDNSKGPDPLNDQGGWTGTLQISDAYKGDYWSDSGIPIGAGGGNAHSPDGALVMTVPSGALSTSTRIAIGHAGTMYPVQTDQGPGTAVFGKSITPHGLSFSQPVAVKLAWSDGNSDGIVDSTSIQEASLRVAKDDVVITNECSGEPGCNQADNTFTVQVSSLSTFTLVALSGGAGGGAVGGVASMANKIELLAPWMALGMLMAFVIVYAMMLTKKKKTRNL